MVLAQRKKINKLNQREKAVHTKMFLEVRFAKVKKLD
jgi:hypothetical protein